MSDKKGERRQRKTKRDGSGDRKPIKVIYQGLEPTKKSDGFVTINEYEGRITAAKTDNMIFQVSTETRNPLGQKKIRDMATNLRNSEKPSKVANRIDPSGVYYRAYKGLPDRVARKHLVGKKGRIKDGNKPQEGFPNAGFRLSEEFPIPSKGEATPEFFQENYLEKLPKRNEFLPKLLSAYRAMGMFSNDQLATIAEIIYRNQLVAICERAWGLIPKYEDELERREKQGEEWSFNDHYKAYWQAWAESGFLYRDTLSQCLTSAPMAQI